MIRKYYKGKVAGRQHALVTGPAPKRYAGERPHGRTLAAAIYYNEYLSQQVTRFPQMVSYVRPVAASRVGKQVPLVAGPARSRCPG